VSSGHSYDQVVASRRQVSTVAHRLIPKIAAVRVRVGQHFGSAVDSAPCVARRCVSYGEYLDSRPRKWNGDGVVGRMGIVLAIVEEPVARVTGHRSPRSRIIELAVARSGDLVVNLLRCRDHEAVDRDVIP